jgi:hypothetical protein
LAQPLGDLSPLENEPVGHQTAGMNAVVGRNDVLEKNERFLTGGQR